MKTFNAYLKYPIAGSSGSVAAEAPACGVLPLHEDAVQLAAPSDVDRYIGTKVDRRMGFYRQMLDQTTRTEAIAA